MFFWIIKNRGSWQKYDLEAWPSFKKSTFIANNAIRLNKMTLKYSSFDLDW